MNFAEHRQVTQLKTTVAQQQQQIEKLSAALTTQARQIEQVSAKAEASYSGTRLIAEK
jgi:uncharacterized coiled-coil protein SlyX